MKDTLNLIEVFSSIQGETSLQGRMTSFIRLQGCPLRCIWCDTPYSNEKGKLWTFQEIMQKLSDFSFTNVCITGGEPLLQPHVYPFMELLLQNHYAVSLETSGAFSTKAVPEKVKVILDIKCPKSTMEHKNHWDNLHHLRPYDEVKFVLLDKTDYEYAKKKIEKYQLLKKCEVLLSPVFQSLNPKELIEWVQEDKLPVRINLQLHKYVWNKDLRGV